MSMAKPCEWFFKAKEGNTEACRWKPAGFFYAMGRRGIKMPCRYTHLREGQCTAFLLCVNCFPRMKSFAFSLKMPGIIKRYPIGILKLGTSSFINQMTMMIVNIMLDNVLKNMARSPSMPQISHWLFPAQLQNGTVPWLPFPLDWHRGASQFWDSWETIRNRWLSIPENPISDCHEWVWQACGQRGRRAAAMREGA